MHALAGNKRGAHLAISLERLDALLRSPAQRIGLSATVQPLDEVARFLGGVGQENGTDIIDARNTKQLEVSITVPVEELAAPPPSRDQGTSIWPHVEARVLDLIRAHRSTIVFANSRRLAERFCARINASAGEELARAHHGSVSREQRSAIEGALKAGALRAVVATSSLELGIDMGAVDLVVQIEAPTSVAAGLQRIGRAGHQVGAVSRGVIFPKYRGDLLTAAAVVEQMRAGNIEPLRYPRSPLDVLAQQIVAMVAMDDWAIPDIERVVRRAAPFSDLPPAAFEAVLDMLSGRFPSAGFANLRPRLTWDRKANRLQARAGARVVAVTCGGTIPDRGLYGVYLAGNRAMRVGELDEEMVYESRAGEVFMLGSSAWRIENISTDRVLVSPAPGIPGKMPFWHGDAPGRPIEVGRALGAFARDLASQAANTNRVRLAAAGCDENSTTNLLRYLEEQRASTGVLPDDRTLVVERFRDAVGDWRLCLHSFFGARVHAPWAQAVAVVMRARMGQDAQIIFSDDGIVVRLPEGEDVRAGDVFCVDPATVEDLVVAELGRTALFASRFRECAGRALLLPRRRPGQRTPLWQQRQKAASLLAAVREHPCFPIVIETYRECLQDLFDLPALISLLRDLRSRRVNLVEVDTEHASPFAASLQLAYVAAFMYEGDAPLAERRAQALTLDRALLAELMGREELRDLLNAETVSDVESELQHLNAARHARHADAVHDLLRALGDLSPAEIAARSRNAMDAQRWLTDLQTARRVLSVTVAGEPRFIAVEDASRYRDALGTRLPRDVPQPFLEPVHEPLLDLVARFACSHGPFTPGDVAKRLGIGVAVANDTLRTLAASGRAVEGEFRPGGSGPEWLDTDVLRRLRRASLAALRREVEPVPAETLARFTILWHGVTANVPRATSTGIWRVLEQLQGVPVPASALESIILPGRLGDYRSSLLDELGAAGELIWVGAGALGLNDGWLVLAAADTAPLLLPEPDGAQLSPLAQEVRELLGRAGALFFRQIASGVGDATEGNLLLALWELVWAGLVTNDTLAPLRELLRRRPLRPIREGSRTRKPVGLRAAGPPATAGRWSLAPVRETDPTRRRHAWCEQALRCHGLVVPGVAQSGRVPGGFSAVYPVLRTFEERGHCRRGYFVEGLGGAQFALTEAIDRLRALAARGREAAAAVVLAATDPANPYGAALPWPDRVAGDPGHRAGRKAGAAVTLVDGRLALFVERGGRTLISYTEEPEMIRAAVQALAQSVRYGQLGKFELETIDGVPAHSSPLGKFLAEAGFCRTYRGLQVRL